MQKIIACVLVNLYVVGYVSAASYFPLKNQDTLVQLKRIARSPNPHCPQCNDFPPFPGFFGPPPPPDFERNHGDRHGFPGGYNFNPAFQQDTESNSQDNQGGAGNTNQHQEALPNNNNKKTGNAELGNNNVKDIPSAALISSGEHENGLTKATATAHAEAQSDGGSASAHASASALAKPVSHQNKICYFCKITDNSK